VIVSVGIAARFAMEIESKWLTDWLSVMAAGRWAETGSKPVRRSTCGTLEHGADGVVQGQCLLLAVTKTHCFDQIEKDAFGRALQVVHKGVLLAPRGEMSLDLFEEPQRLLIGSQFFVWEWHCTARGWIAP
jgi:hypothetical protein